METSIFRFTRTWVNIQQWCGNDVNAVSDFLVWMQLEKTCVGHNLEVRNWKWSDNNRTNVSSSTRSPNYKTTTKQRFVEQGGEKLPVAFPDDVQQSALTIHLFFVLDHRSFKTWEYFFSSSCQSLLHKLSQTLNWRHCCSLTPCEAATDWCLLLLLPWIRTYNTVQDRPLLATYNNATLTLLRIYLNLLDLELYRFNILLCNIINIEDMKEEENNVN